MKLLDYLGDLRFITLTRARYKTARGKGEDYWRSELRRYGNMEKRLLASDYRWYVLEFKDGHRELAYLRVLQGGFFSGLSPAIYRGCIIPHRIDYITFSNITKIRLAF